ncbi:proton-dependent oligopeptide transporter, POT family [Trypanosoma theileri]|uniref:Proton-dependent oligopeptide transporter, POT family n=1 Tax=Trypanosoma theileri TaxID=67003 RepID=A0A1X0P0R8_9TRYP|nr:proton-dependent oligopeptide transporter, POT family [Trypanosoma theileri]ORC90527.1 proton-dependent oligopeptide transporter, POT family [Trypanosoma theileri]
MLLGFPFDVWVVMAVEFTERLAYYGTSFMLMTYCTSMLRWSPSVGNAVVNGLYTLTPVAACISSGLADGRWGRRYSLVVFLSIYAVGLSLLALSSFPFMYGDFPLFPSVESIFFFLLGLLLFSSGYGGMKVCTNPIMADSVAELYKDNEGKCAEMLSRLFRWIYSVTNCGSLVGIFVPPLLRGLEKRKTSIGSITYTTGYYYGFLLSAASCILGLILMIIMYRIFKTSKQVPSFLLGRILLRSIRIRWYFATGYIQDDVFLRVHKWDLLDYAAYPLNREVSSSSSLGHGTTSSSSEAMRPIFKDGTGLSETLWKPTEEEKNESSIKHKNVVPDNNKKQEESKNGFNNSPDVHDSTLNPIGENFSEPLSLSIVEDAKKVVAVCRAFIALPVYWLITNQFSSNLILQAAALNLPHYIPPEVFNNVSVFALLISLLLLDRIIFPYMYHGRSPPMRGRAVCGFLIMIISMIWCGFVQIGIDNRGTYNDEGQYTLYTGMEKLPAGWLLPPYIMQGIASALVDTTVMEVAYVYAPESMKGAVMALYLVASSLSGLLGLILSPVMKPQNIMVVIFALCVALLIVTILFYLLNGPETTARVDVIIEINNQDSGIEKKPDTSSGREKEYLLHRGDYAKGSTSLEYGGVPQNNNELLRREAADIDIIGTS